MVHEKSRHRSLTSLSAALLFPAAHRDSGRQMENGLRCTKVFVLDVRSSRLLPWTALPRREVQDTLFACTVSSRCWVFYWCQLFMLYPSPFP